MMQSEDIRRRLERLAIDEDELQASILNERRYQEFLSRYRAYVARWKP